MILENCRFKESGKAKLSRDRKRCCCSCKEILIPEKNSSRYRDKMEGLEGGVPAALAALTFVISQALVGRFTKAASSKALDQNVSFAPTQLILRQSKNLPVLGLIEALFILLHMLKT